MADPQQNDGEAIDTEINLMNILGIDGQDAHMDWEEMLERKLKEVD